MPYSVERLRVITYPISHTRCIQTALYKISMPLPAHRLPSRLLTGVAFLGLSHLLWVKFCI